MTSNEDKPIKFSKKPRTPKRNTSSKTQPTEDASPETSLQKEICPQTSPSKMVKRREAKLAAKAEEAACFCPDASPLNLFDSSEHVCQNLPYSQLFSFSEEEECEQEAGSSYEDLLELLRF